MAGTYAAKTEVPVAKSKTEVEALLARYGASGFGYVTQGLMSAVMFEMRGRRIIIRITMPDPSSRDMRMSERGATLSEKQREGKVAQAERQRWRALLLVIKAKLESVELGIETFEQAFLSHIVVPTTGQTYGEFAIPQIAAIYETHENPPMLPGLPSGGKVIELPERSG